MVTRFNQNWHSPFVRAVATYVVGLGAAALVIGTLSFELLKWHYAFTGNLLVNVCAGLIVLALGLGVTARFASALAGRKLDELAPRLLRPLRELRTAGAISGATARSCVISAVALIAAEHLQNSRWLDARATGTKLCGLCGLDAETTGTGAAAQCAHCGLQGAAWNGGV